MTTTTDEFIEMRADWYANDCPADHPYQAVLEAEYCRRPPAFVQPLVSFG